jgi:hypothetical protein
MVTIESKSNKFTLLCSKQGGKKFKDPEWHIERKPYIKIAVVDSQYGIIPFLYEKIKSKIAAMERCGGIGPHDLTGLLNDETAQEPDINYRRLVVRIIGHIILNNHNIIHECKQTYLTSQYKIQSESTTTQCQPQV